jgi:hypothetical protein
VMPQEVCDHGVIGNFETTKTRQLAWLPSGARQVQLIPKFRR